VREDRLNQLREGMAITCPVSEGVYLLLNDLGDRGWRCLVIVADVNYEDMESPGALVVISREWLENSVEAMEP
jgi:hypothetical protein